jgi:hypothetical protein
MALTSIRKLALGALGVSAGGVVGLALFAAACSDDPHLRSDGGSDTVQTDGGCSAAPGTFPQASCDNSSHTCEPQAGCTIDETVCGSAGTATAPSCLPIGDNKGKQVLDYRLRRLNIVSPPALAKQFVQSTVVTTNIDLNAKQCGELGKGLFNWLLRLDRTSNTLITGGAPPPDDALGKGFCLAQFTTVDGINIAPIQTAVEFTGDTFKTKDKLKLNIPIFLSPDVSSAVVLPISDIQLTDVTVSADSNCIGSFNKASLDSQCYDDPSSCYKWNTAGALGGYITIKEADNVNIKDLNQSLCAFLTGQKDPATNKCLRDGSGNLPATGDYCSTTKAAGGCKDSFWLAATFAASAAKIFDGKGSVAACSGAAITADAGSDAGKDAGADAGDGG